MKSVTKCKSLMFDSCPKVTEIAIRALIPFVLTYLCESGFLTLLQNKTKQSSRLEVKNDLQSALSSTSPQIPELANQKQSQVSSIN